jgi:predicted permease
LSLFANLMFPVLTLMGAGAVARRCWQVEARPLAQLILYLFCPALVFNSLLNTQLAGADLAGLAAGTILLVSLVCLAAGAPGRILRWPGKLGSAVQLGSAFFNLGNFGLPIIYSTYGQAGLERAVVIVVTHQILLFSLALYLAARSQFGAGAALRRVARMPTGYAALAAFACRRFAYLPPSFIIQPIQLLAQASIPIFLLLLGVQLAGIRFSRRWALLGFGSLLKLGLSPLLASLLGPLLGLEGLSLAVFILAASMPTAVVTVLLAIQYETEPDLVSSLTLTTTLLSLGTIPLIVNSLSQLA